MTGLPRAGVAPPALTVLTAAALAVTGPACARAGRTAPVAAPGLVDAATTFAPAACASAPAVDADHDALDDRCELALAQAFAPELVVDRRDCLWTDAPPLPRLAGGYLFAAGPVRGGVRIAYLPAYFRDCGWSGLVCRVRGPGCGAHAGDSELIAVDVARDGAANSAAPDSITSNSVRPWRTVGVFLSAHCFGRSGGRCRWYRGRALDAFAWAGGRSRGAPRVWVARGKHAHYPTRRACDRGHWSYDTCDGNRDVARFPVHTTAQNVGSRASPLPAPGGCFASDALPLGGAGASAGARECVWDAARPFRGWQATHAGDAPTPYGDVLARAAGF